MARTDADRKEELEYMKELRAIGVKSFKATAGPILEVEFFPLPAVPPLVEPGHFDVDTLVPPPPGDETERPPAEARAAKRAPALARLLKNGSIS